MKVSDKAKQCMTRLSQDTVDVADCQKLLYEWTKSGHLDLAEFQCLLSFIYESKEMFYLKYEISKDDRDRIRAGQGFAPLA